MTAVSRRWKTVEVDAGLAEKLAADLGVPRPLATALAARGLSSADQARHFLNPRLSRLTDPFLLPDMDRAVERIGTALDRKERITIYGDYDADGVTSAALVFTVLKRLGADVSCFLPSRFEEGYGLSTDGLERCLRDHRPALLVTTDCGTASVEAVQAAAREGVDVVVTDHHEPAGAAAPALAVVNPKLGERKETAWLAGVGVAFKLCHALVAHGRGRSRPGSHDLDLRAHLDWVALGTVADVVPLIDENRILVHHGLRCLNRTESVGLQALRDVAGIESEIDCHHIGFSFGPRLNAAGRLGRPDAALRLLLASQAQEACALAAELNAANAERQRIEESILKEAVEEIDRSFDERSDFAVVVAREGWHVGTVGIVAARLAAIYRRPCVVVAFDEGGLGHGSGRSIGDFDLVEALRLCSDALISCGGHKMAAGLKIRHQEMDRFRTRFREVCAERLAGRDLSPTQSIDAWVDLREADRNLWDGIRGLRPFGISNPAPVWGARGLRVVGQPRVVGKDHLKLLVASAGSQMDAIGFGLGGRTVPPGPIDVAFRLGLNEYRGVASLQLQIEDFRPAGGGG